MTSPIKEFGDTAKGLSKNPLGIIALFIVLVYGFASLVVGASSLLQADERFPIIWFLVLFPCIVLGIFAWLVSQHHEKLYAPSDYKNESNFLESLNPSLKYLSFANPDGEKADGLKKPILTNSKGELVDYLTEARKSEYSANRGFFIVHALEPSKSKGQLYDIFIYLVRHKSSDYGDIGKAEFFFGHYWGNKIYEGSKIGDLIGVQTSAYGPFLAICKVTFKDGAERTLSRYIDFEMGHVFEKIINR